MNNAQLISLCSKSFMKLEKHSQLANKVRWTKPKQTAWQSGAKHLASELSNSSLLHCIYSSFLYLSKQTGQSFKYDQWTTHCEGCWVQSSGTCSEEAPVAQIFNEGMKTPHLTFCDLTWLVQFREGLRMRGQTASSELLVRHSRPSYLFLYFFCCFDHFLYPRDMSADC